MRLTPFTRRAPFSASRVMLNMPSSPGARPSASSCSSGRPIELGDAAEMLEEQVIGERIVARGHRRVRGEHALRGDRLEPGLEAEARGQLLAQQLERQERRMAFVHVPDGGREAERAQRAHAADAEHHFLRDAVRLVAAVEAEGDVAVGRRRCSRQLVSSR